MKKQGLFGLVVLTIITLGIYSIVWFARTRGEMKQRGADIPTTWLYIVPIANLYYYYKHAAGVEHVTNGKLNGLLVFVLHILTGIIGMVIVQYEFNNLVEANPASGSIPPSSPLPPNQSQAPPTNTPLV